MIKKFNTIGKEEEEAVLRVLRSGVLSGYVASNMAPGSEVRALQHEWQDFFGVEWAVPCNSATSGLMAACIAAGIGPFDEVIVPYFTMSATACAPAALGATIILADIEPDTFCIDVNDVSRLINENTKAVIATNMFGHPAKLRQLRCMCEVYNITLIEDNAQAIMAKEDGAYTGTIGHIGVFSLNVHKHIQTGEGGICVTRDPDIYARLNDAINHGECRSSHLPGLNLRMTEITAAIAREQLKKLPSIIGNIRDNARALMEAMKTGYLEFPAVRSGCEHSYYALPMLVSNQYERSSIISHLRQVSEIPISNGYDGNILIMNVSNKWIDPKRQKELIDTRAYANIHHLLLIEMCSHEITPEHIEAMKKIGRGG